MDFPNYLDRAWADHANDPAAVAARLPEGLALIADDGDVARLANLAHHVLGEHLGSWLDRIQWMERLAQHPRCVADGRGGETVRRCTASLLLASGSGDPREALGPSDRIRVTAMAAGSLASRDEERALGLFQDALALADASGLDATDPMNRALAITANNLALALETAAERSRRQTELMLVAARAARRYWERAGTWLETERAEYRLAMSCLAAGDIDQARRHAAECLRIVTAHGADAVERFFAWEATGRVERAAGDRAACERALAAMEEMLAGIGDAADRAWCMESLTSLRG
ncbi:MAG TPA: hypothetical protein VF229_00050 [Burkholderiaceae bacterium]